jgi:hypothetical protein
MWRPEDMHQLWSGNVQNISLRNKIVLVSILVLSIPTRSYAWMAQVQVDKMDDKKYVVIYQQSIEPVWAGKNALLVVTFECNKSKRTLSLQHPWIVGDGPIKMRLDNHRPINVYAQPALGRKELLIGDRSSSSEKPEQLIKKMEKAHRAILEYSDAGNTIYQVEFKIFGLTEEINKRCTKIRD